MTLLTGLVFYLIAVDHSRSGRRMLARASYVISIALCLWSAWPWVLDYWRWLG